MLTSEERERIRRAYYLDHQSIRHIAREEGRSRRTIDQAVSDDPPTAYHLTKPKPAPILGPFQARIEDLLRQSERLPPKQRYTAHKIFQLLQAEGYQGCESSVRHAVSAWKRARHRPEVFLPLEFDPGQDAQVDWGAATASIAGVRQVVQVFVMRLSYSRRVFVMAFPSQKQESFFYGHVQAFRHFGGVPHRLSYDNLATAVKLAFDKKRTRHEHRSFVAFRSHYLFESHFCTPGLEGAHEKGGVESGVGFSRRNFLVPIPEVASFEELNRALLEQCLKDDQRQVHRQATTIGQAWEYERSFLRPLPPFDYDCCQIVRVRLTPYSQATFETNRYSVPVNHTRREVTIKAYPFTLEILDGTTLLARHPRCYEREQDLFDPLHYLPLLEQRPGAFDYAKPLRQWRQGWPESYHRMLRVLRESWPEGRGVQEFVRILKLHQEHPAPLVEQAIEQALSYGSVHLDGVLHCLHQLMTPEVVPPPTGEGEHSPFPEVGNQPIDLSRYELLLKQRW
ncbi:MAG TPA: IS21 family transposase [Ktedonobacterales bacterium]|nr:IS21 family transposase [Ktedonobacterales bacterium]